MHQPLIFVPVNTQRDSELFVIKNAFSDSELDHMQRSFDAMTLEEARIGPGGGFEYDLRRSRIAWVAHEPEYPESVALYMKLMDLVHRANLEFGLEVWGFAEHLQYSEYGPGDNYCWHRDYGPAPENAPRPPRKISFTVQLSRSDEYEGGNLQFLAEGQFIDGLRDRGTFIAFPSYVTHRVEPVVSGLRRSLVGWVCGRRKFT